jgi:threonine/homoserine/homoserine lactone efflux protein
MEELMLLVPLFGAVLIGAISPGPSFVLVARTAIAVSRLDGVAAALGMGLGATTFAAGALLGLHAVLTNVPSVYAGFKIIGALYLLHLAVRLWRGATDTVKIADTPRSPQSATRKSFFLGLATQLSNPKTAVVYASIFAAMLPSGQTWSSAFVIVSLIFAIETGWYALVAIAFSAEGPRNGYLRSKRWIDRAAGAVMGLLGLKLASEIR